MQTIELSRTARKAATWCRAIAAVLFLNVVATPVIQAEAPVRPKFQEIWSRTELYFGTQRPNGAAVSDEQFFAFVDREVTPRFPDGLTILAGFGQFRSSQGVLVKERSHVLILFHPPLAVDSGKKIQEIREAYKAAFQQESVLRADAFSVISF